MSVLTPGAKPASLREILVGGLMPLPTLLGEALTYLKGNAEVTKDAAAGIDVAKQKQQVALELAQAEKYNALSKVDAEKLNTQSGNTFGSFADSIKKLAPYVLAGAGVVLLIKLYSGGK
jgi:hypothetical protein